MPNKPIMEFVSQPSAQKLKPAVAPVPDKEPSHPAGSKLSGKPC